MLRTRETRGAKQGGRTATRGHALTPSPPPLTEPTKLPHTSQHPHTDTRRTIRDFYGKGRTSEETHQMTKRGSGKIPTHTPLQQPYPSLPLQVHTQPSLHLLTTHPTPLEISGSPQYPKDPNHPPKLSQPLIPTSTLHTTRSPLSLPPPLFPIPLKHSTE